jgi:hypothetical protein
MDKSLAFFLNTGRITSCANTMAYIKLEKPLRTSRPKQWKLLATDSSRYMRWEHAITPWLNQGLTAITNHDPGVKDRGHLPNHDKALSSQ